MARDSGTGRTFHDPMLGRIEQNSRDIEHLKRKRSPDPNRRRASTQGPLSVISLLVAGSQTTSGGDLTVDFAPDPDTTVVRTGGAFLFPSGGDTTLVEATEAGFYSGSGWASMSLAGLHECYIEVGVGGGAVVPADYIQDSRQSVTNPKEISVAFGPIYLPAGATFQLNVLQDSGGDCDVVAHLGLRQDARF